MPLNVFGVWSLTWWPGVILFFGFGLVVGRRWFRFAAQMRDAKHIRTFWGALRIFLAQPAPEGRWTNRRLFVLMWLCGFTSMLSVAIGDIQAAAPCIDACQEDGWAQGRLRGNPHTTPGEDATGYACWCYTGSEWSPAPIDPERLDP